MAEFAQRGYEGGSTERIARAAGISQPYVFRLFGSKLQLFLAAIERCMDETLEMFERASEGLRGEAAMEAIGHEYSNAITANPTQLQLQLVAYAACDIDEVREVTRQGYGRLVRYAESLGDVEPDRVARFFAKGMLLNVVTAMQLTDDPTDWGTRLMDGCTKPWTEP